MNEILEAVRSPLLLLAAVATGLQAGTYYTWASGVMPGLARVEDDRTFVHVMQQLNVAIVNPVFLATFIGAPVLCLAAIAVADGPARPWVIAGAVLAVATIVITFAGNIPLNNTLDAAGPAAEIADPAGVREAFEASWVRLNALRAVTSTGSLAALVWAVLRG
jgi:uncharacterized membrane protein